MPNLNEARDAIEAELPAFHLAADLPIPGGAVTPPPAPPRLAPTQPQQLWGAQRGRGGFPNRHPACPYDTPPPLLVPSPCSNFGARSVDLAAPGSDILSTWITTEVASDSFSVLTGELRGCVRGR